MAEARDRVAVGVIGRPHGVRGLVRIRSYTERPADVGAYGPVTLADGRSFELSVVGEGPGKTLGKTPGKSGSTLTARLAGIADRDAAAALTGQEIFVPRAALPATAEDEYYLHDLIGLAAAGVDGTPMGRVVAVHDFGAAPVLEIAPDREAGGSGNGRGDGGGTIMVPFTDAAVPVVDIGGGRLVVDPPPGLLDGSGLPDDDEDAPGAGAGGKRPGGDRDG